MVLILTDLSLVLSQIQLHNVLFVTQSFKIPATPKSSISVSPTNRNEFSFSIPSVIKSNDSKPACAPPQTSHLLPFPIKSRKHLFQSSTQVDQSSFSQNQRVFNSASLFQVSELPFQRNATATLPFTIIPLKSSAIYIFLLNLLFNFILLTCSSCFILNFNVLIYILLKVLIFIKLYTNSTGLLFRLMESNRSLIILIIEFIYIFQYDATFNKMNFKHEFNKQSFFNCGSPVSQSEDKKRFTL